MVCLVVCSNRYVILKYKKGSVRSCSPICKRQNVNVKCLNWAVSTFPFFLKISNGSKNSNIYVLLLIKLLYVKYLTRSLLLLAIVFQNLAILYPSLSYLY